MILIKLRFKLKKEVVSSENKKVNARPSDELTSIYDEFEE